MLLVNNRLWIKSLRAYLPIVPMVVSQGEEPWKAEKTQRSCGHNISSLEN
jgi:hypothetical protein